MSPRRSTPHPEHASEQAYIERAARELEARREESRTRADAGADRFARREIRRQVLERLREPVDLDALCFGRIDREDGRTIYLGREIVEDRDRRALVVNWRAPAAEPFYRATVADPQGLTRRRRFQLDRLRLLGIVDEQLGETSAIAAEEAVPEAEAQEPALVDAILADMDRARGDEMRDIVATIEKQQYELISDDLEGLLVIQGGPGSGKTAIALHRAAWLLFNHRDELERAGVLVVGPNRAFMEYVSQVLPSLGETAVDQVAIDRIVDLPGVRVRGTESVELARLKGDPRMAEVVAAAVRDRVRRPRGEEATFVIGRARITLPNAAINDAIDGAQRETSTYEAGRREFRRRLTGLIVEAVSGRALFRRIGNDEIDRAVSGTDGIADRYWPTTTAPEVLRELFGSRQRLRTAAASLSGQQRESLFRERRARIEEEPWTAADAPLLDEVEFLIRGVQRSYGYVLIDEAQDLSPMQLRMVLRRAQQGRATLVGDIAQSTGSWRYLDWVELLDHANAGASSRIAELGISYRVPQQVMELASGLLPRIAPSVLVPRAVRAGASDPALRRVESASFLAEAVQEAQQRAEGDRNVAVIAPSALREPLATAFAEAGMNVGDVPTDGLSRQVTVLSATESKGLEFDHVVVLEPVEIAGVDDDWALVYVALTRTTRTLSVLYTTSDPFEQPTEAPPDSTPPEITTDVEVQPPLERLGARYTEALMQAKFLHGAQQRRGTSVPYFAHLQSVASLVLEDGGGEDEAIAALLHDAAEDHGFEVLERIADQFGARVAQIVAGCTDPPDDDEASWRDIKIQHLRDLEGAGPYVRRVALAEKLDNARALLRDYRRFGDRLWERMRVDPEDLLWYMGALADLFVTERPGDMAYELQDAVSKLLELASAPALETASPAATNR